MFSSWRGWHLEHISPGGRVAASEPAAPRPLPHAPGSPSPPARRKRAWGVTCASAGPGMVPAACRRHSRRATPRLPRAGLKSASSRRRDTQSPGNGRAGGVAGSPGGDTAGLQHLKRAQSLCAVHPPSLCFPARRSGSHRSEASLGEPLHKLEVPRGSSSPGRTPRRCWLCTYLHSNHRQNLH